ncbi:hypothetical protein QYE76_047627 [Lolium multiflorum]|uniref:Reverse transcriptase domain-containing protein n=1 Tax=Lolium multiflorum TaxID=4521 RepID=A0AAD8X0D1_LOLMU|nr:hypothetical protein QYE76_047627 [Lolium multiflorum]
MRAEILEEVKKEIEKMLAAGFIRPCRYAEWISSIVPVEKKDGRWRVAIDFRDLNRATPKDEYPMPVAETLINAAAGHKVLSFMDGNAGYNQIFMAPEDIHKTAFRVPGAVGLFEYVVMTFGLKNAGATYQRAMNYIFHDLIGKLVEIYIDDVVVKSVSMEGHLDDLRRILDRTRKFGLRMNPKKCAFGVTAGQFLGFLVHERGIEIGLKSQEAVRTMQPPTTKKELQRLIEQQQAFDEIKRYLTTPPVLVPPQQDKPFYIYLSVADTSIASVVVQLYEGVEKVVFYLSRRMLDTETRYPEVEKLCLCLFFTCTKLHHILLTAEIIVICKSDVVKHMPSAPVLKGRLALMSDTIEDATELRLWSLEKIKENKARVARAYNKKVRPKEFQVGDLVWEAVLPLGTRDKAYGKWSPNWHGPYKVVQALKGNAYMLEQLDGVKFPVAVNGQHLKKYFPSMWDDGHLIFLLVVIAVVVPPDAEALRRWVAFEGVVVVLLRLFGGGEIVPEKRSSSLLRLLLLDEERRSSSPSVKDLSSSDQMEESCSSLSHSDAARMSCAASEPHSGVGSRDEEESRRPTRWRRTKRKRTGKKDPTRRRRKKKKTWLREMEDFWVPMDRKSKGMKWRTVQSRTKRGISITFPTRADNFRKEKIEFEVVNWESQYHAILGRPAYAKFMAVPHYAYLKLKMPRNKGTNITVYGSFSRSDNCDRDFQRIAAKFGSQQEIVDPPPKLSLREIKEEKDGRETKKKPAALALKASAAGFGRRSLGSKGFGS